MLKIRKRSGEEVLFDRSKIERAIEKANASVSIPERLNRDIIACLLYTSPSPRDSTSSRMPSSA